MSEHDATDPEAQTATPRRSVVSGEAVPPAEHTERIRAERARLDGAPTVHVVHDGSDAVQVPDPSGPSDEELLRQGAERARRDRRRARDRRAERFAISALLFLFAGIGGGVWYGLNVLMDEERRPESSTRQSSNRPAEARPGSEASPMGAGAGDAKISSKFVETSDLPALRQLAREGLTIAAEGLPEVLADAQGGAVAFAAARETCRFAYGVWEFSPNKRFRFLTTCEALAGQILVGAYEVRGTKVSMSPLISGPVRILGELELEHPAMMKTSVELVDRGGPVLLTVNQRVTAVRQGLEGEAFADTFRAKNTLVVPEAPPEAPPRQDAPRQDAPRRAPEPKAKDPLIEMLEKER